MSIEQIAEDIQTCQRCELGKEQSKRVTGSGSKQPLLFFVSECPGRREIESGEIFSGPTKAVIDEALLELGLTENDIWKTSVLKCPTPNYREPYDNEIGACGRFIREELRALNPKIILGLGRVPALLFTGTRKTIGDLRGKMYTYRSWPLFLTYSPSAVKRFPFLKPKFLADLQFLREEKLKKSVSMDEIRKALFDVIGHWR